MAKKRKGPSERKQKVRQYVKENRGMLTVYVVLRLLVVSVMIAQLFNRDYFNAFLCALTLVLFTIPAFIEHKLNIDVPNTLEVIILLFIFSAEILGEIRSYYLQFPYWDTMLHTINGFLMAAIGFSLIDILNRSEGVALNLAPIFVGLFAFCFSMTVGVLWEFFECFMDLNFGLGMQKDTVIHAIHTVSLDPTLSNKVVTIPDIQDVVINGESLGLGGYLDIGIIDTMKDLFVNFIGAVVFSVTGFLYVKSKGRKKSAAQSFVPSKKTAERDYLQQALEEVMQEEEQPPAQEGPSASGEPEGA